LDLSTSCSTADVERAHRELSSGFADRLGCDDSHSFADIHLVPTSEVATVAHGTDPTSCRTGESRTNDYLFDTRFFDTSHLGFIQQLAGSNEYVTRQRINHVFQRRAAQ